MKKIFIYIVSAMLIGQAALAQTSPSQLDISLKHPDRREQQTKEQLQRLLSAYDVSNWIFTRKIMIESDVVPHSHPVLTLSTRHLKDDELLLSTFVHEQLHWYLNERSGETEEAYKELRSVFPKVPVGFPEGGSDEESTYKHILVCYLEYQAVKGLLGELRAKQVMEFWATDHYTWIYRFSTDPSTTYFAPRGSSFSLRITLPFKIACSTSSMSRCLQPSPPLRVPSYRTHRGESSL